MRKYPLWLLAALMVSVSACKSTKAPEEDAYQAFDPASLDSTVRPGDDFYAFVNNKWIAAHPIPADKAKYGAFYMLDDNSLTTLRSAMETAAKANAVHE